MTLGKAAFVRNKKGGEDFFQLKKGGKDFFFQKKMRGAFFRLWTTFQIQEGFFSSENYFMSNSILEHPELNHSISLESETKSARMWNFLDYKNLTLRSQTGPKQDFFQVFQGLLFSWSRYPAS